MANEIDVIVKQEHPEYKSGVHKFRLWRDAIEGNLDKGSTYSQSHISQMVKNSSLKNKDDDGQGYLYRYEYETAKSFRNRLRLSHDFGDSGEVVRSFAGHLSRAKSRIDIEIDDESKWLLESNIDGEGTSFSQFCTDVSAEIMGIGKCWVATDAGEDGIPVSYIIPRENVVDWNKENGEFLFVKWKSSSSKFNGIEREAVEQLITMTKKELILTERSSKSATWKVVNRRPNQLGIVPVVDMWMGQNASPIIAVISKLQINLMNLDSEMRDIIRKQALSILAVPQGTGDQLKVMSSSNYIEIPADAYDPKWLPYPSSSLDAHFKYAEWLIDRIRDLSNLRSTRDSVQISGLSKKMDFLETETILNTVAESLESGMKEVIRHRALFSGRDIEPTFEIIRKFDIDGLTEKIDNLLKAFTIGIGKTAETLSRKGLRDALLPGINPEDRELSDKEIEMLDNGQSLLDIHDDGEEE